MTKIISALTLLYGAGYLFKNQSTKLEFFTPDEFGLWFPIMDTEFLIMLDDFRREVGQPVYVSPAPGSLGRPDDIGSQHLPNPLLNAADLMSAAPLETLHSAALKIGFTGIGLYPDWKPDHGIHLDTRTDRSPNNPATWSAFNSFDITLGRTTQKYTGIDRALT